MLRVRPSWRFNSFSNLLSCCAGMGWRIPWMTPASSSSSWISSPPSAGASTRRPALCSCSSSTSQPSPTRSCCRAPPPAPWMLLYKKVSSFGEQQPASLQRVARPPQYLLQKPAFLVNTVQRGARSCRCSPGEVLYGAECPWLGTDTPNTHSTAG